MDQDIDSPLYEMLLKFVHLTAKLNDGCPDYDVLLIERMDVATQMRQRGFMISEQQQASVAKRLMH